MWFWNRFEILGILLKIFIFIGAFCFFDKAFFLCKFRQKEYFWNFSYLYFKLLQNYNQCVNIPKTVSEISTMGESIQIKKVHSVYITLWTLHLRKEGDSNPRYPFEYVSLANWWFQPLTHPSKWLLSRWVPCRNRCANVHHKFVFCKYFRDKIDATCYFRNKNFYLCPCQFFHP